MWEANKKYTVSVDEWGLSQTKTGTPYVWVGFVTAGVDGPISWRGWLTSKAKLSTYRTLLKLGWNESLDALSQGVNSNCLNTTKEFEIETQLEEWTAPDGNSRSKVSVKWINDPQAMAGEKIAEEKMHLLNQNLKADLLAIKQEEKAARRLPLLEATQDKVADVPF